MIDKPAWTIRSSNSGNQLVGIIALLIGIPFILLTIGHIQSPANAMAAFAGFSLGLFLIGTGVVSLLFTGEKTVIVDPEQQRLMIQKFSRVGNKSSIIGFDEVASVLVNTQGGYRGPRSYHLKIALNNGKMETTGRWSLDQGEIIAIADQLAAEIGCKSNPGLIRQPINANQIVYAGFGAVILYAIWFRIWVGPWCTAMWLGTAPPVIILIVFSGILGMLRIMPRQ